MKFVIAVVKPERLNDVLQSLDEKGVALVSVTNVAGRGRQKGLAHQYRGLRAANTLINKAKLEIAVNDEFLGPTVDAIKNAGHTGEIGDGKIFVLDLEQCIRIRTGEEGAVAVG